MWQTQNNSKAIRMNDLEDIRKSLIESFDGDSPSPLIQVFIEIYSISLDLLQ